MRWLEGTIFWGIPVLLIGALFAFPTHSHEEILPNSNDHIAHCVSGLCWVKRAGDSAVRKLVVGDKTAVQLGDQVVTLGKGSFLAITLSHDQGSFRVRDTSVVTIEEGFKLLSLISSDGGSDDLVSTKAAPPPPTAEPEKTPEQKAAEEAAAKAKAEAEAAAAAAAVPEDEAAKKKAADEEAAKKKAAAAASPDGKNQNTSNTGTMFLGKTSLDVKYPPKDTTFVSFRYAMKLPFAFETAETISEADAKLMGSWTLVQMIDEKNVRKFQDFQVPFMVQKGKRIYSTRVEVPTKGLFAFVPTSLLGDPQYQLRIRFRLIDREEYKQRIQDALKGLKPKMEERIEFLGN